MPSGQTKSSLKVVSLNLNEMMNNKKLLVSLKMSILLSVFTNILSDLCNVDIIGYNKSKNKHWCKIYDDKQNLSLYLEMELEKYDNTNTYIIIHSQIGTTSAIEEFIHDLIESIQLYKSSFFVRMCLRN